MGHQLRLTFRSDGRGHGLGDALYGIALVRRDAGEFHQAPEALPQLPVHRRQRGGRVGCGSGGGGGPDGTALAPAAASAPASGRSRLHIRDGGIS